MITRQEIIDCIRSQNIETLRDGIQEIAKDAGYTGKLHTVNQLADYCEEDEDALEFLLA